MAESHPSDFHKIATVSELPAEGEAKSFACGARMICVARINGDLAALDDVCPHRGGPLGAGIVEGTHIVCPWHGWEFEAHTGKSVLVPDVTIDTFELKIEGEDVLARKR